MPDDQAQSSTQLRGTVENKAPKPAGLLPKKHQQLVILGVAVVMVADHVADGHGKRRATSSTAHASRSAYPASETLQTVRRFQNKRSNRNRQQRGSRFRRRTSHDSRRWALRATCRQGGAGLPPDGTMPQPGGVVGGGAGAQPPPPPDPVKEDKKSGNTFPCLHRMSPLRIENRRKPSKLVGSHGGKQCFGTEHGASPRDNRLGRSSPPDRSTACGKRGKQQPARPGA